MSVSISYLKDVFEELHSRFRISDAVKWLTDLEALATWEEYDEDVSGQNLKSMFANVSGITRDIWVYFMLQQKANELYLRDYI